MGFLDNSGDIILDAVLTDLGRERLARGDGSFKITKFAAADDEIDYGKYNKNNPSGSAYYDLDILTTPVLEAFTNNIGSCKHKLMTIPRNNLLYLPVVKLANSVNGTSAELYSQTSPSAISNLYMITVDEDTSTNTVSGNKLYTVGGIIRGDGQPAGDGGDGSTQIVTDQGLDTTKIPSSFTLDSDLIENQYIIEIDDRLGKINTPLDAGNALANPNFIDDDRVASYYISRTSNPEYIDQLLASTTNAATGDLSVSAIAGPRGTRLKFTIRASLELNTSTSLFTRLGGGMTINPATGEGNFGAHYYIDTTVRVTGVTTGYRLDIPIRFIKKA